MPLPVVLPDDFFWKTLDLRLCTVRSCFKAACDVLSKKSGIHWAMETVEAAVAQAAREPKAKLAPDMGRAIGLIWRLGNSLTILAERRIDFTQHLKLMRHGEARFGQRDPQDETHFKDFELELNVAAQLCDRSARNIQLHPPGHAFDITMGDIFRVDCKHPTSEKGIAQAITDFGKALGEAGEKGAIVIALEDVLELSGIPLITKEEEIVLYAKSRMDPIIGTRAQGWIRNFEANESILGIYFTATAPVFIDDGTTGSFALIPLVIPGPTRTCGCQPIDTLLREFVIGMR
jgi:hypothetical protein